MQNKIKKKIKNVKQGFNISRIVKDIKKVDKLLKKINKNKIKPDFQFPAFQSNLDKLRKEEKRLKRLRKVLEGELTLKQLEKNEILIKDIDKIISSFIVKP